MFRTRRKYDEFQIVEIIKKRKLSERYTTIAKSLGTQKSTVKYRKTLK